MDYIGAPRGLRRGDPARPPSEVPIAARHPTNSEAVPMAAGIHQKFFYVHIRGCIRFHFLDLHQDGRINFHGGMFAAGPVTASGWHGVWAYLDWRGDRHYSDAMVLSFSYRGDAGEFHHLSAAQCRYHSDCWVCYEDGTPHAIMYRLPWPHSGHERGGIFESEVLVTRAARVSWPGRSS